MTHVWGPGKIVCGFSNLVKKSFGSFQIEMQFTAKLNLRKGLVSLYMKSVRDILALICPLVTVLQTYRT